MKVFRFIRESRAVQTVIYICVMFFLILAFWNQSVFGSDEAEIFIKGEQIARGKRLYTEIASQHMPLMYYLSFCFSKLGVETIAGFRGSFYILFSILWGVIYSYFGKSLGRKQVGFYPVVYLVLVSGISNGTCILSEQLEGIGMTILFYEMIIFYKKKSISLKDCILISLAIFISFGSAFVSAFGIFAAFLFVLLLEIRDAYCAHISISKEILYLIKKYITLVVIVLLPFILLLGYYWHIHTIHDFYRWAYKFNTVVYPKYTGGYGDNVLKAFFGGITYIAKTLNITNISITSITNCLVIFIVILFFVNHYKEYKDKLYIGCIALFIIACATRGCFSFHGLPVVAVFSAICALSLSNFFPVVWSRIKNSQIKIALLIITSLSLSSNYLQILPNNLSFTTTEYIKTASVEYALDKLTDKYEEVGFTSLDYSLLLKAGVLPASIYGGACPWFWEWLGDQAIAELYAKFPRVYYYEEDLAVWGYKLADYAPELQHFIDENYRNLGSFGYPDIYVRRDYYNEAISLLEPNKVFFNNDSSGGVIGQILSNNEIGQVFYSPSDNTIIGIETKFATYARKNSCTLEIQIKDNETGEISKLVTISGKEITDNEFQYISVKPQNLEAGHSYAILFSSPDGEDGNALTIYRGADISSNNHNYATIDGEKQPFNLSMVVYSNSDIIPSIVKKE